jgi:hypothetical protein
VKRSLYDLGVLVGVLVLAFLAACGGREVMDPADAGACLVTGAVCDPGTMLPVGTCTYDRCAPPPPESACTDVNCPIPNTTCDVEAGVTYIVACPVQDQ